MIEALVLLLVANGTPVVANRVLGGRFRYPLDGNRNAADGKPWLGRSKTFLGVVTAVIATAIVALLIDRGWALGAAFALLSMAGDLASSFVKRRLGLPSGRQVPVLDQAPEALLPLVLYAGAFELHWPQVLVISAVFLLLDLLLTHLLPGTDADGAA